MICFLIYNLKKICSKLLFNDNENTYLNFSQIHTLFPKVEFSLHFFYCNLI